ncbi:uncharacterized protein LOC111047699 isoform X2 [Nilaparvata lugens]|uniref:uncharacterized protein LOC111047699 isoform X2 n=1 Tax=Nilaparvata lugens TaxID=108931 RepID=UPI00193E68AC|nr:uncharacterized protein LOC111047699 isoform X2 [Nilaparvata lugens]
MAFCEDLAITVTKGSEDGSLSSEKFVRKFKACLTAEDRFSIIEYVSADDELTDVFKSDMPIDILGELIEALLCFHGTTQSIVTVYRFLEHISKVQRFNLSLEFLSRVEKEDLKKLFDKVLASMQGCQQDLAEDGITEWEINSLRKLYKV